MTLIATLAIAALPASAASAAPADFAASSYPAHGLVYNDGTLTFTSSIGTLTCATVGESQPLDGTGVIEEQTSALTVSNAQFTNCHATVLKLPVTVDQNGCDLLLTAGTMVSATTAEGSAHLECPAGKEAVITIFANKTKHTEGVPGCVIDLAPQTPTAGVVTYKNLTTANGQKVVTGSVVNAVLDTKRTAGSLCTAAEETNTLNGSIIAEATEGVDVELTGT